MLLTIFEKLGLKYILNYTLGIPYNYIYKHDLLKYR